jgi:hypothetical protein
MLIINFIKKYVHTYIHACIPTYIHASLRTYIHTYIHTCILTYIHTYMHPYVHTYIPTYTHTHTHTHTHIDFRPRKLLFCVAFLLVITQLYNIYKNRTQAKYPHPSYLLNFTMIHKRGI